MLYATVCLSVVTGDGPPLEHPAAKSEKGSGATASVVAGKQIEFAIRWVARMTLASLYVPKPRMWFARLLSIFVVNAERASREGGVDFY